MKNRGWTQSDPKNRQKGMPMKIKVFPPRGCDRSCLDEKSWMDMPSGSTVGDVLKVIKCSPVRAKLLIVSVNGEHTGLGRELHDGDVLGFFSLVSGG